MGIRQATIYRKRRFRAKRTRPVPMDKRRTYVHGQRFDEVLPMTVRLRPDTQVEIVDERLRCKSTNMDREFWSLDAGRQAARGQRERVWQRVVDMTSTTIQGWRSRMRS